VNYSVTTVCMPEYSLQEQARLLRRLGFNGMELRVRPLTGEQRAQPYSFWGNHKNDIVPETFQEKAAEVKRVLAEYDLVLPGIASAVTCLQLDQIRLLAAGAQAAGAGFIRVGATEGYDGSRNYHEIYDATVRALEEVLEITRSYGTKVVIEMHGGTIHPSASLAHRIVANFDPADIGVIYDPQNMVKDGFETIPLTLQLLGDYLAHLHVGAHRPLAVRNEDGSTRWTWEACSLEEGLFPFPTLIRELKKVGYGGYISVEDFRTDISTEAKLQESITYLKSLE